MASGNLNSLAILSLISDLYLEISDLRIQLQEFQTRDADKQAKEAIETRGTHDSNS